MKKTVNEIKIEMTAQDLQKERGHLKPTDTVKLVPKTTSPTSSTMQSTAASSMTEDDAAIKPKDAATIKYLSNVKDVKTGEVSKPFSIGGKNYQMVRGITPSKEIVMGVFCHDELNENGENIIHPVNEFEENIVKPVMEMEKEATKQVVKEEPKEEPKKQVFQSKDSSLNLAEFKHYIVNEKTGKFRKFKTSFELAEAIMEEGERYMGIREFKKFFENKVFGGKKNSIMTEDDNLTGQESEEEMNVKAQKLMQLIQKRIPSNIIATIKTPIAKREVIAAFAEMIGVPRQGLANLVTGLKDMASQSVSEHKIIKKIDLIEGKKPIRTIKIKNIEDEL
jgi:hypothetical protein